MSPNGEYETSGKPRAPQGMLRSLYNIIFIDTLFNVFFLLIHFDLDYDQLLEFDYDNFNPYLHLSLATSFLLVRSLCAYHSPQTITRKIETLQQSKHLYLHHDKVIQDDIGATIRDGSKDDVNENKIYHSTVNG